MDDTNQGANNNNRFAPPVAQVEDVAPVAGELAGRGTRFVAAMIDGIACALIMFVVGLLTSVSLFSPTTVHGGAYFMSYGMALLIFLSIQGWLLHQRSQTMGKIAMSIRIQRPDGSKATVGRLIGLRLLPMMLIGLVPLVGPLISLIDSLLIFRNSHRCLHDDIADTIVVRV